MSAFTGQLSSTTMCTMYKCTLIYGFESNNDTYTLCVRMQVCSLWFYFVNSLGTWKEYTRGRETLYFRENKALLSKWTHFFKC